MHEGTERAGSGSGASLSNSVEADFASVLFKGALQLLPPCACYAHGVNDSLYRLPLAPPFLKCGPRQSLAEGPQTLGLHCS